MNIKTVAESVADEATIALLRKHRVDYAQGYHIGKPSRISGRQIRGDAAAQSTAQRVPVKLARR
jgi:EAL domain-containing protein (putative c-di-GMP-specific phosphodiesterase class I)